MAALLARRARVVVGLLVLLALPGTACAAPRGEAQPAAEPPGAGPVTLLLLGDVMLGRGVAQALDGDWEAAFEGVRPDLDAPPPHPGAGQAIAIANLESPLTALPQIKEGHDLRAPPAAIAALASAGIDAVSLANNHALDAGEAGLRETERTVCDAGLSPWLEGRLASIARAPGVRGLALDDSARPLDVEAAAAAVAGAVAQGDAVVVSIHWGGEYQAEPSARQRAIARALAGAGATVIAGHGPHVLQRVEWVGQTLVAYSLGNSLFDQRYPVDCRWGAILRVTLQDGAVVAVEAIPTVADEGRVRRAEGETADAIAARLGVGE